MKVFNRTTEIFNFPIKFLIFLDVSMFWKLMWILYFKKITIIKFNNYMFAMYLTGKYFALNKDEEAWTFFFSAGGLKSINCWFSRGSEKTSWPAQSGSPTPCSGIQLRVTLIKYSFNFRCYKLRFSMLFWFYPVCVCVCVIQACGFVVERKTSNGK